MYIKNMSQYVTQTIIKTINKKKRSFAKENSENRKKNMDDWCRGNNPVVDFKVGILNS